MPRKRKDLLTQVREQAERTLAMLTAEIRRREADLENLLEQARLWRDAITSSFSLGSRTKKAPARKAPAKKKRTARGTRGGSKAGTKKRAKKAVPAAARRAKASAKKSRARKVGTRRASRTG